MDCPAIFTLLYRSSKVDLCAVIYLSASRGFLQSPTELLATCDSTCNASLEECKASQISYSVEIGISRSSLVKADRD